MESSGGHNINLAKIDIVQWENPEGLKLFWHLCSNTDGHKLCEKFLDTHTPTGHDDLQERVVPGGEVYVINHSVMGVSYG